MGERFRNFYIDHVPHQQNAHADALASLTASLALSARAAEKILVYNHDLYCPRFAFEDNQKPTRDLQVKKALDTSTGLELRDWWFPYIDYALYGFLPDDLKRRLPLEEKPPNSTTMRSQGHCITDRTRESSSAAYHRKRHKKYSKRLMMVCVELTNLA